MNTRVTLVLITSLLVVASNASAQVAETLPSVPRADGTGPSTPSLANPGDARGSQQTQAVEDAVSQKKLDEAARPRRLPMPRALRGDVEGQGPTESAAGEPDINTSLDTTAMAQQIRAATINDRPILIDALLERLAAGDQELVEVKRAAARLTWSDRRAYKAALKELRDRRRQLDDRMAEARRAKPENWIAVRDALSLDYQAYWVAMTRVAGFAAVAPR
jgi:hypothetical protein